MRKLIKSSVVSAGLLGIALAVAAPLAVAQPAGGPPPPARERAIAPAERLEARLVYYKTLLKITPAQEAQWNAVAEVVRKQATDFRQRVQAQRPAPTADGQRPQRPAPKSALERLDDRQKGMQASANAMSEFLAAARPLYASFSDEQKRTADELLGRAGPQFGKRGFHGHHRG